jgi:putative restriction endonuclease
MSQPTTLEHYLHKRQKLRQGGTAYGKAPHKPVLLLSVLQKR